jgi:hypothetical protein
MHQIEKVLIFTCFISSFICSVSLPHITALKHVNSTRHPMICTSTISRFRAFCQTVTITQLLPFSLFQSDQKRHHPTLTTNIWTNYNFIFAFLCEKNHNCMMHGTRSYGISPAEIRRHQALSFSLYTFEYTHNRVCLRVCIRE